MRFESRWGTRYPGPIQTVPEAHPASYTMGNEFLYSGVKRLECGADHPPLLGSGSSRGVDVPLRPLGAFMTCYAIALPRLDVQRGSCSKFSKEKLWMYFWSLSFPLHAPTFLSSFTYQSKKMLPSLQILSLSLAWTQHPLSISLKMTRSVYVVKEPYYIKWFCHVDFFGATAPPPPQWARAPSFTRFLDHTQRHTTLGRTPLDEWSARRRDFYVTTHNTHDRHPCPSPPTDGIRTRNPSRRAAADPLLRHRGHPDRHIEH